MGLTFDEFEDLESIRERLRDADPGVRRIAVMDLAEAVEPEAAGLAIAALAEDPDPAVRAEAARVLYEFEGDKGAIAALLDALGDADESVRLGAAETLAENKDRAAGALLLQRVDADDAFAKAAVLRALRELRLPETQGPALAALEHADARVRREAVGALAYLKTNDVLMALMSAARHDADAAVRRAAMGSLVFSNSDKAVATLIEGIRDPHWQVREEAAFVLGKVGWASALDALVEALNDAYWQVRLKAAASLGQLQDARAVAPLGGTLASEVSNLRKEAAGALGEIGAPEALVFLEKAAGDPDPDVRKVTQWSIERIKAAATR